ncbi:MAG: hypothetical protein GWN18_11485, partial [Thermoplasmata archaeon]|nr:hypothetical protein [Thermoplasmata archaeon]NIS12664.1 hypothetical protein [Thermoplasmata archaeon]NIS20586.1 hypothetical protein [Thermoplasmata archaeon]NIT77966.1 hypothetical protein [Thermoplasmata archaeon]NIU49665.1 hypothetical protein [Thermoplasmata archaeon]
MDTSNVTFIGSRFSNNTYDGLNTDTTLDMVLEDVIGEQNGYNGICFQAGSDGI